MRISFGPQSARPLTTPSRLYFDRSDFSHERRGLGAALSPSGAPSLSRFVRQGGDFDFLTARNRRISNSKSPPCPCKDRRHKDGAPSGFLYEGCCGNPQKRLPRCRDVVCNVSRSSSTGLSLLIVHFRVRYGPKTAQRSPCPCGTVLPTHFTSAVGAGSVLRFAFAEGANR